MFISLAFKGVDGIFKYNVVQAPEAANKNLASWAKRGNWFSPIKDQNSKTFLKKLYLSYNVKTFLYRANFMFEQL